MIKSSPIAGHTTWIRLAALGAVVVLGACAAPSGRAQAARIGMPNPASAYCVHLGGWLELRSSPQGTTGWCHLPDGTIIEEWALFRRNHSTGPR